MTPLEKKFKKFRSQVKAVYEKCGVGDKGVIRAIDELEEAVRTYGQTEKEKGPRGVRSGDGDLE